MSRSDSEEERARIKAIWSQPIKQMPGASQEEIFQEKKRAYDQKLARRRRAAGRTAQRARGEPSGIIRELKALSDKKKKMERDNKTKFQKILEKSQKPKASKDKRTDRAMARRKEQIRAEGRGGDDDASRFDGESSPADSSESSLSTRSRSKKGASPDSSKSSQGPQGPQGPQGGMSNMLLPLMLMRGGLGGNKPNEEELKALHKQNEKDKAAAKEAIDKMKSLMVTLEELKETVKREHEKMDKRDQEKGCNCSSNSKIEKKVEELSDKLEESDVVEALEKCRKTLKKYKNHLEKLHAYSIYLQKLTVKIQHKLKHNIKKTKTLCSNKKRKKSYKSKKK